MKAHMFNQLSLTGRGISFETLKNLFQEAMIVLRRISLETSWAIGLAIIVLSLAPCNLAARTTVFYGGADQPSSEWTNLTNTPNAPAFRSADVPALRLALDALQELIGTSQEDSDAESALDHLVLMNDHRRTIQEGLGEAVDTVGGQRMVVPRLFTSAQYGQVLILGEAYGRRMIEQNSEQHWREMVVRAATHGRLGDSPNDPAGEGGPTQAYDSGEAEVHITRRMSFENWPEIMEGGDLYQELALLIRHRSAPGNVRSLLLSSNLRSIWDHIIDDMAQQGVMSLDVRLVYRIIRNSNGVAQSIVFEAPGFTDLEGENIEVRRIPEQDWLQMAIDRLQQGHPELEDEQQQAQQLRSTLLRVFREWHAGNLTDGQYISVQQIDASLGTVWRGGAYSRGSQNISGISMNFLATGRGNINYYSLRYARAEEEGTYEGFDHLHYLDRFITVSYQYVQSARDGLDHLRVFTGEHPGLGEQHENRSAIRAMVAWRNARRSRPAAFLSYICSINQHCGQ